MAAWSVFSVPLSRRRVVVVGMRNVQNKTNRKCYHNVEEQYLASNLARSFALCVSLWADEHGLATAAVDRRCRRMLLDCRRRRCRCCLCPQLQLLLLCATLRADGTFLCEMGLRMLGQMRLLSKAFAAQIACKWFFACGCKNKKQNEILSSKWVISGGDEVRLQGVNNWFGDFADYIRLYETSGQFCRASRDFHRFFRLQGLFGTFSDFIRLILSPARSRGRNAATSSGSEIRESLTKSPKSGKSSRISLGDWGKIAGVSKSLIKSDKSRNHLFTPWNNDILSRLLMTPTCVRPVMHIHRIFVLEALRTDGAIM